MLINRASGHESFPAAEGMGRRFHGDSAEDMRNNLHGTDEPTDNVGGPMLARCLPARSHPASGADSQEK